MKYFSGITGKVLIFVFLLFIAIFISFKLNYVNYLFIKGFYIAGFITLFNFLIGSFSLKYSLDKPYNLFLFIVFGGMIARLFILLLLIFISLKFLEIKIDVFIFEIFIFYFFYLFIEILSLLKEKKGHIQ